MNVKTWIAAALSALVSAAPTALTTNSTLSNLTTTTPTAVSPEESPNWEKGTLIGLYALGFIGLFLGHAICRERRTRQNLLPRSSAGIDRMALAQINADYHQARNQAAGLQWELTDIPPPPPPHGDPPPYCEGNLSITHQGQACPQTRESPPPPYGDPPPYTERDPHAS